MTDKFIKSKAISGFSFKLNPVWSGLVDTVRDNKVLKSWIELLQEHWLHYS